MMKIRLLMMAVVVLIAAQSGFSQTIVGSAHDFSGQAWNLSVGKQICIVCHTPHNASTTVTDAPLWNHATTATVFALYTSNTLNATASQPDGSSKLCLSCHDGTVAIENFGNTTTGSTLMAGARNLGVSLSNDHPISFTYDAALATADGELQNPTTGVSGLGGTINANMLYGGKMQCATCHDVHNSAGLPKLLVKSNAASALCLTCHKK
jgi:predicted CXXCH cytochrome family protein